MPDDPPAADATEHDVADHLAAIAQQSQRIAARFLSGQGTAGAGTATDPLNLSAALGAMARSLAEDPSPLIDAQMTVVGRLSQAVAAGRAAPAGRGAGRAGGRSPRQTTGAFAILPGPRAGSSITSSSRIC